MRALQLSLALLNLASQGHDLLQDERVLLRDPVDRIHPAEHVVEARRAEQNDERRVLAALRGVDIDETRRKLAL